MKKVHEHDFRSGVQVDCSEMEAWHKDVLRGLQSGEEAPYIIRSGNGMVIGRRSADGEIIIYEIANGYKEFIYI